MQGWEKAIYTLSLQRPQPQNTNLQKERRGMGNSILDKKGSNRLG